ncbi:ribonuclease J [uncultured Ruminococcus sp.]|uniref:ribonuclease J n=1 Tax=uncultured Ruminococcus sp. TaxID=165186 RepID=UPI000ED14BDB|nr:ribonuclease J [uncultured Ruminococcus sp.]HCJ42273.1 RNase J family beta-CASP ribonuclease [Ruminococcus sp.]
MANNNSNSEKRKASKRYTPKQGKLRGVPLKRKNDGASAQNKLRPNGRAASQRTSKDAQRRTPVKIIPLGGLNEIGKNFTVIECSNDMFIIDCGLAFPDSEMLGVDIVIPDFTYVEKNLEKLRGVVITHGHEDHIGGLPYFLKKFPSVPVYGTRLTIGLIEGKLREHELLGSVKLNTVTPRQTIRMGCMAVEFIRVNHSIPDSVGMAIHTPAGVLIHTGDFKVDYTPIEGGIIDLPRFAELGNKGVLALMSDSTNSERPGYTASERKVGDNLEMLFTKAEGKRIIIATFASNIHRVQQIINNAVNTGRKVAVSGRSMVNVISVGIELGYLKVPDGVLIDIDMIGRYLPEQIVLVTTGSQGEPMSALSRMSMNEHRKVSITPQDFIIISANPIPGNEKLVTRVVNDLMKLGAEVVYEKMYEVHVSGHACQEEQKLMLAITKPKFFIPVHGEFKHLMKHKQTAMAVGIPEENIIIAGIGDVIETDGVDMRITGEVPAGKVLVDGLGVGDVGAIVLRDRKHLAEDGLIIAVATIDRSVGEILSGPDLVSRGFVYVRESEELMNEAKELLTETLQTCLDNNMHEWNAIKGKMKDNLSDFIFRRTKRSPMILPIIMEI